MLLDPDIDVLCTLFPCAAAENGGAFYFSSTSVVTMNNVHIEDNWADLEGGGICKLACLNLNSVFMLIDC